MFNDLLQFKKYCDENEIRMVDFKMIDLMGRWRHLSIPAGRLTEETLKRGVGFDGSNYGFAPVEKSDMVFIPDLKSAILEPFAAVPTLSMIGDVFVTGDVPEPFSQYPRVVAKRAEDYMRSTGIADEMKVGPEFEFYIFDKVNYHTSINRSSFSIAADQAEWNGIGDDDNPGFKIPLKGGYHIMPPMDLHYDLRNEMCVLLEECGVRIKYHHHEVGGPGQQEIEVESSSMCDMADQTMLIKYVIRNAVYNDGMSATFMPKPLWGEAGNGMHVHMHLFKDGAPVFYDKDGYSGLSSTALHFIGGILSHARALCAITNPSTNSFKRLVPGYEAPVSICYATANRSAVIRIPDYAKTPDQKRFELRNPDATCNPYYAFAAILMAGLDGVERRLDPTQLGFGPYDINLYKLTKEEQVKIRPLPYSLHEALDALEEDHAFLLKGGVFTERLVEIWLEKKREEARSFDLYPHPVEFARYYDL